MHELKSLSGQYGIVAVNPTAPDAAKVMAYGVILSSSPSDTLATLHKQESCRAYTAASYDIGGQNVSVVVFRCGSGYGTAPVASALEAMLPPLEKGRAATARKLAERRAEDLSAAADMVLDGVSADDAASMFTGVTPDDVRAEVQKVKLARATRNR